MRNNVVIVSISLTAKTPGSPLPSARQYCVVPLIFRGEPGEASISERFTRVLPETLQLGPVPRVVSVISQLLTGNHSGAEGAGPTDRRAGARSLGTQTDGEPWAIPSTQCRPEGLPTNVGKKNRKLPCLQVLRESSALHQHQACNIHDGDRLISWVGTFPPSHLRVFFLFIPTFCLLQPIIPPPSRQLTNYLLTQRRRRLFSHALLSRPAPATLSHTQPDSRARLLPRP